MIVRVDPDYLEHASKSKYKGGFTKDGKNTSAYNHDYYIHNKEKWKDNEGNSNSNPFGYEDKYESFGVGYDDDGNRINMYYNKKTGESKYEQTSTVKDQGYGYSLGSRKRNGGKITVTDTASARRNEDKDTYNEAVKEGVIKEAKTAKVYKRGEGIGGGPSGTKDYNNRSSVSVNKRKKGRKPVGKVWTAKY